MLIWKPFRFHISDSSVRHIVFTALQQCKWPHFQIDHNNCIKWRKWHFTTKTKLLLSIWSVWSNSCTAMRVRAMRFVCHLRWAFHAALIGVVIRFSWQSTAKMGSAALKHVLIWFHQTVGKQFNSDPFDFVWHFELQINTVPTAQFAFPCCWVFNLFRLLYSPRYFKPDHIHPSTELLLFTSNPTGGRKQH